MERPRITAAQREMAVAMLANAIRKEAHLRARADEAPRLAEGIPMGGSRRRQEASGRYVQGMRDLLAVLFVNGRAVADDCYAAARAQALGEPAPDGFRDRAADTPQD